MTDTSKGKPVMTIDLDAIRKRAEPFRGLKLPNPFAQEAMDDREALLSHITAQDAEHKAEMVGKVVVPIEPTPEMVEAGRAELSAGEPRLQTHARVMWVWEAMIAAYLAQKEKKDA